MPPTLAILHESRTWLAIDKPAGLLSVPGKGEHNQDCVASRVRSRFPHATGPITVHRLDMDTSGVILVGLTADSQRELSRQFECREVAKTYVALVEGLLSGDSGLIDLPIRPDLENRPYQVVDAALGRPSSTRWMVLARETDRTRVRFEPLTGRAHQLRVHAAHPQGLNAPILGDVLYGGGEDSGPRLALHAASLTFTDPDGRQPVTVTSRVPF